MPAPNTTLDRLSGALSDRYTIVREIGAGGMATVYLAEDIRHRRKVAIKVLHPELTAVLGPERFLNEIELTANLQHPHILPLFDSGAADNLLFYVMPYVEGETLRQKLTREQQLPIAEAVRIASDVADALEYAHKHGVVHRDIKPENVLLHDGRPLVADFGIALAVQHAGGARMTQTGMSLGTPQYMAPEQAMGDKAVDHRADIYALGAVTYEMLTGEPPFTGLNAQAIVAKILTTDPSPLLPKRRSVPPHVEAAVLTALEKMPADRFATAAQFAAALANPESVSLSSRRARGVGAAGSAPSAPWHSRVLVPVLIMSFILATGAAAWGWLRPLPVVPRPVVRFAAALPENASFSDGAGRTIAMSPAGDRFVYVGRNERGEQHLFLRSLSGSDPVVIPNTRGAGQPFFSPDGAWLGFSLDNSIKKVLLAGGPVVTVASADSGLTGPSWGPDDIIVVGTSFGLRRVPAAGGRLAMLTVPDSGENVHRFPSFLPNGRTVLFQVRNRQGVDHLAAVDLRSGKIKQFEQLGSDPRYVEPGHVLLGNTAGSVAAVPFDAERVEITGEAVAVLDGVIVGSGGAVKLGVSRHGAMVYASGISNARSVVLVDRKGAREQLTTELRAYGSPRYSPDGRTIALDIEASASAGNSAVEGGNSSIWTFDPAQKILTRLTFDRDAVRPFWSRDGSRVAFSIRADTSVAVAWVRADGSAQPEPLLRASGQRYVADDWSREGRTLVIHQSQPPPWRNDIMLVPLDSASRVTPYLQTHANEGGPAVSPDGRWLAYFSDESGRSEVYVRAFPAPGAKIKVSLSGGLEPRWSRDGTELFYRLGDQFMAARVRTSPTFSVTSRSELFRKRFISQPFFAQYDVAPDGRHFLFVEGPQGLADLMVVLNWFDQLRGRQAARPASGPGQ